MITGSCTTSYTISKIEHNLYKKRLICFIFSGLGFQWFEISKYILRLMNMVQFRRVFIISVSGGTLLEMVTKAVC